MDVFLTNNNALLFLGDHEPIHCCSEILAFAHRRGKSCHSPFSALSQSNTSKTVKCILLPASELVHIRHLTSSRCKMQTYNDFDLFFLCICDVS